MQEYLGYGFAAALTCVGAVAFDRVVVRRAKREREAEDDIDLQRDWPKTLDPSTFLSGGSHSDDPGVQSPLQFVQPPSTIANRWIFGNVLTVTSFRVIRKSEYSTIWNRFQKRKNLILLLTGHPGIGKSLSLDVFLGFSLHSTTDTCWLCLTSDGIVHFLWKKSGHQEPRMKSIDGRKMTVIDDIKKHCREMLEESGNSHLTIFHDCGALPLSLPFTTSVQLQVKFNIMAAYSFHHVQKKTSEGKWIRDGLSYIQRYCLPVLNHDEARSFFNKLFEDHFQKNSMSSLDQDTLWEEVWQMCGGVPRSFQALKLEDEDPKVALAEYESDLRSWMVSDGAKSLLYLFGNPGDTPSTSKLAYPLPSAGRRTFPSGAFLCVKALDLFLEIHGKAEVGRLWDQAVQQQDRNPDCYGRLFETCVIAMLRIVLNTSASIKILDCASSKAVDLKIPKADILYFTGTDFKTLADLLSTLASDTFLVPKASNFPVLDAVLFLPKSKRAILMQMTVANQHQPTGAQVDNLLSSFKELHHTGKVNIEVLWIVDEVSKLTGKQSVDQTSSVSQGVKLTSKNKWTWDNIPQFLWRLTKDQYIALCKKNTK